MWHTCTHISIHTYIGILLNELSKKAPHASNNIGTQVGITMTAKATHNTVLLGLSVFAMSHTC